MSYNIHINIYISQLLGHKSIKLIIWYIIYDLKIEIQSTTHAIINYHPVVGNHVFRTFELKILERKHACIKKNKVMHNPTDKDIEIHKDSWLFWSINSAFRWTKLHNKLISQYLVARSQDHIYQYDVKLEIFLLTMSFSWFYYWVSNCGNFWLYHWVSNNGKSCWTTLCLGWEANSVTRKLNVHHWIVCNLCTYVRKRHTSKT